MGRAKMKIIDTFNEILQCYQDGIFDISCWNAYSKTISLSFNKKIKDDIADYDFNNDVFPVLQALIQNEDKLTIAHNSFCEATLGLANKIYDKLGTELDVLIVFYLGLCNGAGWATTLEGKPAILLGVEKIVELDWHDKKHMQALIYHELGHIWHQSVRTEATNCNTVKSKSLWQIYSEGIAMYIEHLLCGNDNFYHQDTDHWLDWCNANRQSLYKEYIRRIDNDESVQQFFGDWCNYNGKSDVGYYLGCELVKTLSERFTLYQLANFTLSEIEYYLRQMCLS